ncbi:MAG: bifunctional glutamate N-acetyltransferase/amino-acid acetyltransferase ArgJ [Clostridia bacterium]|nr:bifunctional glutamate N-acetyltransferase/amino-acid acetyltransferase ArgJ [Clostridia bacterium]
MKYLENASITSVKGFKAAGIDCGIKANGKKDLALIVSDKTVTAAGVYTRNIVKGHSLQLTMERMKNQEIDAVIINSGCANACVGDKGAESAINVTKAAAEILGVKEENIAIGSTGVIGYALPEEKMIAGVKKAYETLSYDGGHDAELAMMTTDTVPKEVAVEVEIGGKTVTIAGMAKGSGMIHPNMGTMISIITTDVNISKKHLNKAIKKVTEQTFNRVSVDGDTSVCDMCLVLANGNAENEIIEHSWEDYRTFVEGLTAVCDGLSRMLAKDGEGATKLLEVVVKNAWSKEDAYTIACAVAKSPLCKTAFFGEDANWGRILTAAGYSGAAFDPERVDIYIGDLKVCANGAALPFDEDKALEILKKDEVLVTVDLKDGTYQDHMWTCDFSYDYVKINGSYRT